MPFEAGLDTGPARLASLPTVVAQGENDAARDLVHSVQEEPGPG
jgi:hypothetical protein